MKNEKNELYHFGVKGQKWGIRRYQNEDGSLTDAGRTHYGYGSVSLQRNENNDSYIVSKKNSSATLDIKRSALRQYEKEVQNEVVSLYAEAYGVSLKNAEKFISNDKELAKEVNDVIDTYMDYQLSSVLDNITKQSSNTKSSNTKKPKYTQEQAIEKAYNDLEKKYPNFNDLSEDEQDELWINYVNDSGLYKYI